MQEKIQGSNIWNAAWKNRPLIQEHAFWEIRNGQNALFWTDSWQQMPPLQLEENLQSYENHIQDLATLKVADLWTDTPSSSPWRRWKSTHQELQVAMDCDLQHWKQATTQRRIRKSTDQDILRWGYTPHGSFTLKEGYTLQEKFHNLQKDSIWTTIWKSKLWPKISTFLWLLLQNKILTWDNLQR
jgi:hypothetical protein